MKITVLGCGRWGTFLACYHSARHEVMLWGREGSRGFAQLKAERRNQYEALPDNLLLGFVINAAQVGFGELAVMLVLGLPLRLMLQRTRVMDRLLPVQA